MRRRNTASANSMRTAVACTSCTLDAARLFQLSADQGNQYAQAHLGSFYMHGVGVQQSEL